MRGYGEGNCRVRLALKAIKAKTNKGKPRGIPLSLILSTLPSASRASSEFLNGGNQYAVSGKPAYGRQHTTAGSDPLFV